MCTPTTEISNAIMMRKDVPASRLLTASSKPFVVTSLSTKRYVPAKKTAVQKLPAVPRPQPTPTKECVLVRCGAPTKQATRPRSIPAVDHKAEKRRPSPRQATTLALKDTIKVRKSHSIPPAPNANQSLSEKPSNPLSTQVTTSNDLTARPSCIPRFRPYQSSVGLPEPSKQKQGVVVQRPTTAHTSGSVSRKQLTGVARTAGHVRAPHVSIKSLVVAGNSSAGMPTKKGKPGAPPLTATSTAFKPISPIECSPPASPHLSSFPSQSWTIVVDKSSGSAPRNPGTGLYESFIDTTGTARGLNVTLCSKNPTVVVDNSRVGTSPKNGSLTVPMPIAHSQLEAASPISYVGCSPPPSPDLSSFPSQSWTIVVDKGHASAPRSSSTSFQKSYVDPAGTTGCLGSTPSSTDDPVVADDPSAEMPVINGWSRTPAPVTHFQDVKSISPVECPTPVSPDLSSFPSQSWIIAVDVDTNRVNTPAMIRSDKALSNMVDALKSGVPGTLQDSSTHSESVPCSPALSSPTVVETLSSPAKPLVGSDGVINVGNSSIVSSAKVSRTECGAMIVSPSRNDATSSMATLTRVMGSHVSSSAEEWGGSRTRAMVQCAFEITRTFFSPSRRISQPCADAASPKVMSTNVSRLRKLFVPPLDKDAKASKNVMTQMEIEMLRAQKKVGGGGVVDSRLDRLGSLSAMAIVTKLRTSGLGGSSRV